MRVFVTHADSGDIRKYGEYLKKYNAKEIVKKWYEGADIDDSDIYYEIEINNLNELLQISKDLDQTLVIDTSEISEIDKDIDYIGDFDFKIIIYDGYLE